MTSLTRFLPDRFTLMLIGTVTLASLLPAQGRVAAGMETLTTAAIAALFFLHGARLSREAVLAGVGHWRLHLLVLASTFVLFPLLGLALKPLLQPLVTPTLYTGVLYLCVLPSTVQSSIALTAMARGNVPAAVCSASASTLLGVLITPVLVNLLVVPGHHANASLDAIGRILLQLMVPFVAGHLLRPWVGGFVQRNAKMLKWVDQGSILLVVYTAFSAAVVKGLWHQLPLSALVAVAVVSALLLALALGVTNAVAKRAGFSVEDRIAIVFCGSKKSVASGVPMANVLFPASMVGPIVLPVMLYHQIQLMACAVLAQRYARRAEPAVGDDATAAPRAA
ncbi:bile acid:sodium symporter family protein [Pseudacidovorax intermedius]|uniref:Bile acid:sodium symporter n=1 Tax=Pseudacidovorax intermedius TaxID=433924 RepID=A0A147GLS9_9BURK|nr:bile acid:sodium symporter family protein [Pseudacidovorax intermedius]KTT14490.1 bile acid:sodium symporter [Pseudacidovorax intermedius]